MIKAALFSIAILTACVTELCNAALVITFVPATVPALGDTAINFDVTVTNNTGATVNVNAMKFDISVTGVGATLSATDPLNLFRTTSAYIFSPTPPATFGTADNGEYLNSVSPTVIRINDTAEVPNISPGNPNERVMVNNQVLTAARVTVNFAAPNSAPYSFTLSASSLAGTGNELGGAGGPFGTYNGFGFGSQSGGLFGAKTMLDVGLANTPVTFSITAVPEPSTFLLLGLTASAFGGRRLLLRKNIKKRV